jgi:hypothetical protein
MTSEVITKSVTVTTSSRLRAQKLKIGEKKEIEQTQLRDVALSA